MSDVILFSVSTLTAACTLYLTIKTVNHHASFCPDADDRWSFYDDVLSILQTPKVPTEEADENDGNKNWRPDNS